jgi:hypothetical protein
LISLVFAIVLAYLYFVFFSKRKVKATDA